MNIDHFYSLINQLEATSRYFSSDMPPCAKCSARIQQGNLIFDQDNQQTYNALRLASEVEAFNRGALTPRQIGAHEDYKRLLAGRSANSLVCRLGAEDARHVSEQEFVGLLHMLAAMFFPGTLSFEFQFCEPTANVLGACASDGARVWVMLHPILHREIPDTPRSRVLNERVVSRLSTLLHELCHAFVCAYACEQCPGYYQDVSNMMGHGFGWQRTALAIEFAAQNALGLPFNLGRFDSIMVNFQVMWPAPSTEEAARWHLEGHPAGPRYILRACNRAE